jgi:hypothetical protein
MAGKLKKGQRIYMRPAGDSYEDFKAFVLGFARALGGDPPPEELDDDEEEKMRQTYEELMKARGKGSTSKEREH